MIHNLVVRELVVRHVYRFERPEEVETRRLSVLILDPTARFQGFLHVAVASLDDEDFGARFHPHPFLPLLHIGDVQLHGFLHGLIALKEIVEGFWVNWLGRRLGRRRASHVAIFTPILQPAVLLLAQRWHVLELLLALLHLVSGHVVHALLALDLGLLLLLLLRHFLLDCIQLLLLPLSNGLGPGLAVCGLFEDLLLPFLIKGELLVSIHRCRLLNDNVAGFVHFGRQGSPTVKVLG